MGALASHLILITTTSTHSLAEYAALRHGIAAIAKWLLLPSLLGVLVCGLLPMAVHRPFQNARWAWTKAALGLAMFEGTLGAVQSTARRAAELSAKAVTDASVFAPLADLLRHEWIGLWTIMVALVGERRAGGMAAVVAAFKAFEGSEYLIQSSRCLNLPRGWVLFFKASRVQ